MTEHLEHDHHFEVAEHWSEHRKAVANLLQTKAFKTLVPVLIILSVCLCIVQTELRANGHTPPLWADIFEGAFQLFFIAEVSLRIHAQRWEFFKSSWNNLDLAVVIADTVLTILEEALENVRGPPASILRMFRIIRTLRISRVLVDFRELYLIVHGMLSAVKTICWGLFMITVFLTIWSIVAVEVLHPLNKDLAAEGVYSGCDRCERAFSTISHCVLTFLQTIVAGDSWGVLAVPLIERHPWTVVIFAGVLGSVQLGLMNLILAVIVDRATDARQEDSYFQHLNKEEQYESYKKSMEKICADIDNDGSGMITKDELLSGVGESPEFTNLLKLMDISKDELGAVFNILDTDRSGSISHKEFVQQLHKMRNGDSHTLLMLVKHDVMCVGDAVKELQSQLNAVQGKFDDHKSLIQNILDASPSKVEDVMGSNAIAQKATDQLELASDGQQGAITADSKANSLRGGMAELPKPASQIQSPAVTAISAISEVIVAKIQDEFARLQKQLLIEHAGIATLDPVTCTTSPSNQQAKLYQATLAQQDKAATVDTTAFRLAAVPSERFRNRPLERGDARPAMLACCDRPEYFEGRGTPLTQINHHN